MDDALMDSLLELEVSGTVSTMQHDEWTLDVFIDEKWFGLWDTTKNTFVE